MPLAVKNNKLLNRGDVSDVFITHAHPDHVGGLSVLQKSLIHVGASDVPVLTGAAKPPAFIPMVLSLFMAAPPVSMNGVAAKDRKGHLHLESRFDRVPDLSLIGIDRHLETKRAMIVLLGNALLGHQRTLDYVV